MTYPRWLGACLFGAILLSSSRADDPATPPRHVRLPGPADPDPDRSLSERLARLKNWRDVQDKARGVLTEDQLKKLLRFVQDHPDGLSDPKDIEKIVSSLLGKQLGTEEGKTVEKLIEQALAGERAGSTPPKETPPGQTPPTSAEPGKDPSPGTPPKDPAADAATSADRQAREEVMRQVLQLAKHFDGLAQSMPDSPAFQEMARALGDIKMQDPGGAAGADASLESMIKAFGEASKWIKGDGSPDLRELPAPPRWGNNLPPPSSAPFPRLPPSTAYWPGGPSFLPGSRALTVLAVIAVAGVLLVWWFRRLLPGLVRGREGDAWRLGPWPVDPSRIASRQDLVRAFEYLALLRFGAAARAWNHRNVAAKFSEQGWESYQAVQRLAEAYERARYAPEDGAVDEAALSDARADLCFLAGVARA